MTRFLLDGLGLPHRLLQGASLALFLVCACVLSMAQGGPPLQTDDPGTPGNGNWEINVGVTTDRRANERQFEAPIVDMNYGLGDRIQVKYQVPFLVHGTDSDPTRSGLGNSLFGFKWRFLEDKKHELQIGTYPQLEFNNPTASADRGLVDRGTRLLLPVELTKKVGPVDVNGELGYWVAQHGPDQWIAGLALGHRATERLELLGEVYATRNTNGRDNETTFGLGGRYKLKGPVGLLFMAGRSFHGPASGEPQFIGYLGLQFQLSSKKHVREADKKTPISHYSD
jgi:hypothetical protein